MVKGLLALVLLLLFPFPGLAQDRVKFPVGVSSKVLGYGHLWAAWRRGYFEREGLDAEVVLMRGTAPAVQALIAGSIYAGLIANDGPIAAVEQGMDIIMVAGSSTARGSGHHQRIGCPSWYQGKMPCEYAASSRSGARSPPAASNPFGSVSASCAGGNASTR